MLSGLIKLMAPVVAPDENYQDDEVSGLGGIWSIVAPDPEFEKRANEASAVAGATVGSSGAAEGSRSSSAAARPVQAPPPAAFDGPNNYFSQAQASSATATSTPQALLLMSPPRHTMGSAFKNNNSSTTTATPSGLFADNVTTDEQVEAVMGAAVAARETANTQSIGHSASVVMRTASSATLVKPGSKAHSRLSKTLRNDPSLAKTRAVNFGELAPNGCTPLMAAAMADNIAAVEEIIKVDGSTIQDRDLYGAAAIHHAAEKGNVKSVQFLKEKHEEAGQNLGNFVDLAGRTPYGKMFTSPNPKRKNTFKDLSNLLFSPEDRSIHGTPLPTITRHDTHKALQLAFGQAEMPGQRIDMEDATCLAIWQSTFGDDNEIHHYCLLGVCDGHGDKRKVSEFVAGHLPEILQDKLAALPQPPATDKEWQDLWTTTCLECDKDLKKSGRQGGSTGIFALVTANNIVVANVGDSRCFLVQQGAPENNNTIAEAPELVEEADAEPSDVAYTSPEKTTTESTTEAAFESPLLNNAPAAAQPDAGFSVVALSEDHKPNLPEERARIENAKHSVIEVEVDGMTIYKVQKTETNMLSMSRAFGDDEYKDNKQLGPDEQAVIAVPEVRVHRRNAETDMYLVLMCDGITDVMSNEDVAKFVVEGADNLDHGANGNYLSTVGDELLNECLDKGSKDNMTVLIVALSHTVDKFMASEVKTLHFASPPPKK